MSKVANSLIRDSAKAANIRLWEIADHLGITDASFSRKLRHELPVDEQNEIIRIINELSKARDEVDV